MATLQETLRKNKQQQGTVRTPGGQLSSETTEGIQTLAGQVGIAPPTTPLGAAGIGANPDQQKMMGSPAQKTAALDISGQMAQGQNLQTAVRTGAVRTQATAEEQATEEKSEDMKNLGSLGQRVTSFINAAKNTMEAAAVPTTSTVAGTIKDAKGTDIVGDPLIAIKGLLGQYRALQNPNSPEGMALLVQINTALGYDTKTQWPAEKVNEAYEAAVTSISRSGAENMDDALTVSDIISQPEFGYDINSLSQLLGVPAATLQGMSVGQLRSEIERVGQEEFSKSQQLQEQAQSGILGAAERGLARQAGREASATGLRASEADVRKIEQSIQNADRVMFAGTEMSVEDMLKDENISNTIKEYMESAPDSDFRKMLERTEPQLKRFIDTHKAILEEATRQMEAGASEFKSIQEENMGLTEMAGIPLDKTLIEKLIPGYNTLQAKRVDPQSVPLFAHASTLSDAQKIAMANALNMELAKDSTLPDQLSKLTVEEIAGLGIGKPGSNWDKASKANEEYRRISNIPSGETQTLLQSIYSDYSDASTMQTRLNQARSLSALGLDPGIDTALLSSGNLKQAILSGIAPTSLKSAAAGNISQLTRKELGTPKWPGPDTIGGQVANKIGQYAMDGAIDGNDLNAAYGSIEPSSGLAASDAAFNQLIYIENQANAGKGSIDRFAARDLRNKFTKQKTQAAINAHTSSDKRSLQKLLGLGPQHTDMAVLSNYIYPIAYKGPDAGNVLKKAQEDETANLRRLGYNEGDIAIFVGKRYPKTYGKLI